MSNSKVSQQDLTMEDQDIRRFEVFVADTLTMEVLNRAAETSKERS